MKITRSSVQNLNIMDKAIDLLEKRGVTHEYSKNRPFINIKTMNGVVQYYPLTLTYKHGVIHGYVDDNESIIHYVARQGIAPPKNNDLAIRQVANNPFLGKSHSQLLKMLPIENLAAISFSKDDSHEEIDHKRWLYKQYGLMQRAVTLLMENEVSKFTPRYLLLKGTVADINAENFRLKKKYPFLAKNGVSLQGFIIDCLKEDISEEVWQSYVSRAEQKRIDAYFKEDVK